MSYVTFIDDMSLWATVHPLRAKSDFFAAFKKFQLVAERKTRRKMKSVRSDGGGAYISTEFREHLESHGILHQLTVAYTPYQNGVAERINRTVKDLARAMLLHRNIPQNLCADAVVTTAYIRNRATSRGIPSDSTPYSLGTTNVLTLAIFEFSVVNAGISTTSLASAGSTAKFVRP